MQTIDQEKHFLPEDDLLDEYESAVLIIARRRVVKLLYRSKFPISIYDALNLTKISINSLAAVYCELSEKGYLILSNYTLSLTSLGRRWALKNRKLIFMREQSIVYKTLPKSNQPIKEKLERATRLPSNYCLSKG